jgi:hypothetical protein
VVWKKEEENKHMYTSGNPLKDFWMHCPWICPLIGKCSMTHPPPRKNPLILKLLLRLQKSVQRQSEHSYNCSLDRSIIGRWMCKFTIAIITFSSAKLWKVIIFVMSDRWTMGRMDRQIDGLLDRWTMGQMDRQIIVSSNYSYDPFRRYQV